jgi:protein disulfide-isomerase A6
MFVGLLAASAGTIELTPANFDKEVFESGKSAFVKFLAPW